MKIEHDEALERVRAICLGLAGATEKIAWSEPTFRVKGRMFATLADRHHDDRVAVWFNAPPGAQETLVGAARERFFVPPYWGPKGWVGAYLDIDDVHWEGLEGLLIGGPWGDRGIEDAKGRTAGLTRYTASVTTLERLYEDALTLPAEERTRLAELLYASVDGDELPPLSPAWEAEIERRIAEHEADPGSAIPWEEARARIFGPRG